MGCSIYYNSQKFECLKFNKKTYKTDDDRDMNQIYVHGTYKHIETGQIINVATTHLKAGRNFADMRATQARQLVDLKGERNLILTGDMNDEPESEAITVLKEDLDQASELAFGNENEFTTWKYRESHGMAIRTIDYIFTNTHSNAITGVHRYLALPEKDLVPKQGNPNANHPSDHYALGYEFTVN